MRRLTPVLAAVCGAVWMEARPALGADVAASPPRDLSVTLYRSPYRAAGGFDLDALGGFALVSETRTVSIPAGESRVRFEGVADGIDPASAIVTGLPSGVIEKNRDAHLLSPSALVALTLGRRVALVRRSPHYAGEERLEGRILSDAGGGVVFRTTDGIEALRCSGLSETFSFDGDTSGLSARPTLSVLTRSPRALSATVTLSYLASGFDWTADYVATLSADGRTLDLGAWLTLANGNAMGFADARTQAVAGRLNHATGRVEPIDRGEPILATCWPRGSTSYTPQDVQIVEARSIMRAGAFLPPLSPAAPAIIVTAQRRAELEQLGDLKLYRAPERTTVASRQSKQIRLLDRQGVPVERIIEADLPSDGDQPAMPAVSLLRMRNDAAHHLGLPLPSGRMAIFRPGSQGPLVIGQTPVRDLAEGEQVEWRLGDAPDVQVAQTHATRTIDRQGVAPIPVIPGVLWALSAQLDDVSQVEIANASPEPRVFELRLQLQPGAALVRADHLAGEKDGRPIFRLTLAPTSTTSIRYQTGKPPTS